ncbi:MAG: urease accessory protein UreD [Rubrivivax sp.]
MPRTLAAALSETQPKASSSPATGGWRAHLVLRYRRDGERTVAHDRHSGPLRVLQRLYPEGPAVCHHVLVHPPGGIVGGDQLEVEADLAPGSHALLTTPGATRCYRSTGACSRQSVTARVAEGARLEWLPLEAIAHNGCEAENRLRFELAAGAEMIGWDTLALGLPAAGHRFLRGRYLQHLEFPGRWLERGLVDGADPHLIDSPLGWAGHSVLATAWIATGGIWPAARLAALVDAARHAVAAHAEAPLTAGVTSTHPGIVVLRLLADRVEPSMALLVAVRAAWRQAAWGLMANAPRIWQT